MQINLRRALNLRKDLEKYVNNFSVPVKFDLNVDKISSITLGSVEAYVNDLKRDSFKKLDNILLANEILGKVRLAISKSNIENNIEDIICQIGVLERKIKILNSIANVNEFIDEDTLLNKIKRKKNKLNNDKDVSDFSYGIDNEFISTNMYTKSDVEKYSKLVAGFKREKVDLQDKRNALNVSFVLEFNEEETNFLMEIGLI